MMTKRQLVQIYQGKNIEIDQSSVEHIPNSDVWTYKRFTFNYWRDRIYAKFEGEEIGWWTYTVEKKFELEPTSSQNLGILEIAEKVYRSIEAPYKIL